MTSLNFASSSGKDSRYLHACPSQEFPQISADFLLSVFYPVFMQNWTRLALMIFYKKYVLKSLTTSGPKTNQSYYFNLLYSSSETGSSHSLEVSSPSNSNAKCENQESGAAPCQCFTPAGI